MRGFFLTKNSPVLQRMIVPFVILCTTALLSCINAGNAVYDRLADYTDEDAQYITLSPAFVHVLWEEKLLILHNTRENDTILLLGNEMSYVYYHFAGERESIHLLPFSGRWELEFPRIEEDEAYAAAQSRVESYCAMHVAPLELEYASRIVIVDRSLSGDSPRTFKELLKTCLEVGVPCV